MSRAATATFAVPFLAVVLFFSCVARADVSPGPVWELGAGLEYVSVSQSRADGATDSGMGAQLIYVRGSLLGALTRSLSNGKWMAGDYLGLGIGAWFGEDTHVRLPLELGLQVGAVIQDQYQVVLRGGVMGVGASGGEDGGGYGALFFGGRCKWDNFAGELTLAPRIDGEEGGFASIIGLMARFYVRDDINIGLKLTTANRRIHPPSNDTLRDTSVMAFVSMEE